MKAISSINSLRGLVAAGFLGTLAVGLAPVSSAAEASDPTIVVKYADLNVSSQEGATLLYRRIRAAALQVCDGYRDARDLTSKARQDACVQKAISGAVVNVNRTALFAVYTAKNGNALPVLLASIHDR